MKLRTTAFYRFIREREQIRLNRAAGRPKPWTRDKILQQYSFTNVKRVHDRTTVRLKAIYDQHQDARPEVQLINAALYRMTGRYEFAETVWMRDFGKRTRERIRCLVNERQAAGLPVYTGAYMIRGAERGRDKIDVVLEDYLLPLWRTAPELCATARTKRSWRKVMELLTTVNGYGPFMAKELVLDTLFFRTIWPRRPRDWNTWCPAGPGAVRGVSRVLGNNPPVPHSQEECMAVMLDLFAARERYWPEGWVPLELHDVQFQLCEFDKYERVRLGQGRPRKTYPGV